MTMNPSARNIFQLLIDTAAKFPDRTALFQPVPGGSRRDPQAVPQYKTLTWAQFRDSARHLALGLDSIGIQQGDIVVIHSETRLEFFVADFGILGRGAISAALYTAIPMPDQAANLRTLKPKAVIVETAKTRRALQAALGDMHLDTHWIQMTGSEEGITMLDDLIAAGAKIDVNHQNAPPPSGDTVDSISAISAPCDFAISTLGII